MKSSGWKSFDLLGTMPLATAGALENLSPLVFRDHSLELQQQLIFRCGRAGRSDKQGLDADTSKLLDE